MHTVIAKEGKRNGTYASAVARYDPSANEYRVTLYHDGAIKTATSVSALAQAETLCTNWFDSAACGVWHG